VLQQHNKITQFKDELRLFRGDAIRNNSYMVLHQDLYT